MFSSSLVDELRRAIKDQQPILQSLNVSNSDSTATAVVLECTQKHLILTATGGTVIRSFDLDLTNPLVDTIGKLAANLARMAGVVAILDNDADPDHPSADIESFGPMNILVQAIPLRHRVFSDRDLHSILESAVLRHNPSMLVQTIPPGERGMVLQLAQSMVILRRATDASKRRGTSEAVADLLALAKYFEEQYVRDSRRLQRVIQSPQEPQGHRVGQGDILLGSLFRRSLRTGTMSPSAASIPPPPVVLCEPNDLDEADVNIRVRWERPTSTDSYSLELWRDSQPEVSRSLGSVSEDTGFSATYSESSELRRTTSVMACRLNGPWGIQAMSDEDISRNSRVVSELEPETDYYFRIFLSNVNGEFSRSNVVRFRTKPLRCRFRASSPLSATSAAATTVVTVNFDAAWGAFTTGHSMTLGEKTLTVTPVSGTQVTFVVPLFQNKGRKQLVVRSPTGLTHVLPGDFEVV